MSDEEIIIMYKNNFTVGYISNELYKYNKRHAEKEKRVKGAIMIEKESIKKIDCINRVYSVILRHYRKEVDANFVL